MKPSERRKQMKEEMAQRTQESYQSKDDSGKFKSYIVRSKLGKVPIWKCSEDEHFLNMIPFVAGEHHPKVPAGGMAYMLDIQVHRKVGVNEDSYICMARTYGKACCICENQAEVRKLDDYDEKFVKSLNPTRRVLYNIECLDSEKQQKLGIQLFDVSHYLFEKELAEIAKKPRGGGFIAFTDPDDGKTVFFRKSGSGATNTEFKAFAFEDRDEPISDELLDTALCLDDLLHIPTYEEVYAAYYGVEEPPEHEDDHGVFECPGERPDNYGEMDACDDCPDAEDCASELAEKDAEGTLGQEEQEQEEQQEEQQEPETQPEPEKTTRISRREAAKVDKPVNKPVDKSTETDPSATVGRRIRRRPGS